MSDRAAARKFNEDFLDIYTAYLEGGITQDTAQRSAQTLYNGSLPYDFSTSELYIPYTLHALGVELHREDFLYDYKWSPYYRGVKNKKRKNLVFTYIHADPNTKYTLLRKDKVLGVFDTKEELDKHIIATYGELWIK